MSGDWQRLDELASAAVGTHNRIANRYLAAWGGLESGLAELMADPKLGWLDYGYGMRHVTGHLKYSDRQDELHRLMDQYSWYAAHQEQGRYVEYRSDLARARRLAAQRTDRALAAGEIAPTIGREIRYSLMDASVESVCASMTPGLLGALVERRLLGPQAAAWHIRAIVDSHTRVEMVASLMCVRYRRENASLAELAARHTWDLVFPPLTLRSWEVAGDVLYHLPRDTRESCVASLLEVAYNPDLVPKPGQLLGMLARSLSDKGLEDAINVALAIQGDDEDKNTALIALVPHLSDSMLGRIAQFETNQARPKLQRVLALRLATSCHAGTEWATKYIVHELRSSISGLHNDGTPWSASATETLLNGLDDSRRAAEIDEIVADLAYKAGIHQFPPLAQNGAAFFSEMQAQRLLASVPRKPIGYSLPYALSRILPGLPADQRPAVVTEALRVLRKYKDPNPLLNDTIRALAPHMTTHNMADIRALVNARAKDRDLLGSVAHAEILAALSSHSSNPQENAQLRQEAVTVAANCSNELKADATERIAPYLDQETRHIAFGLVELIEPGGKRDARRRAVDALVAHVQDEEELRYARSVAERIHDPLSQDSSFAGMAGYVANNTRDRLRGKIEQLVDSTDSRERAGVLIMLAHNFPDVSPERHQLLRRAASLIPTDREIRRWGTAAHLAAVRPVLTPREIQDRILAAVGNHSLKWECLDTWNALTPGLPDTHVRQIIKSAIKRRKHAGEHELCELIAMGAPHLRQSEIDKTRVFAEGRHERYRVMPLAALVHRISEPHRGRIIRQVLEDIRPRGSEIVVSGRLLAQPLAALAPAMTDDEREELIDIIVLQRPEEALTLLAALAEFFPRLPGAQQARVMAAATDAFPESFLFDGPDFPKVVRHADAAFLQRMFEAARYSSENLKVEAIIAVLGSPTTTNNGSWFAGGSDLVGPLRELFTGLTRPSLLRVLGAAAPHIAAHGGKEAVEECVTAVEDVTRWWP